MSIQYATLKELPQLLHLEEQSFSSDLIEEHYFKSFLKKNGTSCHLLIWVNALDSVLGYILVLTPKNRINAVIHSFAVDPGSRGLGIGEMLLESACNTARLANKPAIVTHVRVDNPRAITRYKKSGFHIIGAEANYYEDGCDSVKYLRKL